MRRLSVFLILLILGACSLPKPYLYYGNYSRSYYNVVKKQDAASKEKLKESLERVFERSARYEIPVPPGLYCDYGLIMMDENRPDEAQRYFELEKQNWSGSAQFMDFLMQRYQLGN